MNIIKKYFWYIVFGTGIIFFTVFLRDLGRIEELKSLLRRKKIEEEVLKIKEVISKKEGQLSATEEELVELAEKHKEEVGSAEKASEEDIYKFYKNFFKK